MNSRMMSMSVLLVGPLPKFSDSRTRWLIICSGVAKRAWQISFRLMMSLLVGVDSLPCMSCSILIESVGGLSLWWLCSFVRISWSMAFLRFTASFSSAGVCGLSLDQPPPARVLFCSETHVGMLSITRIGWIRLFPTISAVLSGRSWYGTPLSGFGSFLILPSSCSVFHALMAWDGVAVCWAVEERPSGGPFFVL